MKPKKLVDKVTKEVMDGATDLEKEINAYLTKMFILGYNVPADESLDEARAVIKMVKSFYKNEKKLKVRK